MKNIVLLLVSLLFGFSCTFSQKNPKEVIEIPKNSKNKIVYYVQNRKPNGSWTFYYNEHKQVEGEYVDGYRSGEWKFYDQNGNIRIKGKYAEGQKSGCWYYYVHDTLISKLVFDPENVIDTFYGYWSNGTIAHKKIIYVNEDKSLSVKYSDKGKIIEKSSSYAGKMDGVLEQYNEEGKKTLELVYKMDKLMQLNQSLKNVLFPQYYKGTLVNGTGTLNIDLLNAETKIYEPYLQLAYANGEMDGNYKKFYANGNLYCEGNYKEGYLDGCFSFYDESGQVISTECYDFYNKKLLDYEKGIERGVFDKDLVVTYMPRFLDGSHDDFRKYIESTLKYPVIAAENGVMGRVFVQFSVNSIGEVEDVEIVRDVDPALDKESLRVVNLSPYWNPGFKDFLPVKVQFTFPIGFLLQ